MRARGIIKKRMLSPDKDTLPYLWVVEHKSVDYIIAYQTDEDLKNFLEENIGQEVEFKTLIDPYGQHVCSIYN